MYPDPSGLVIGTAVFKNPWGCEAMLVMVVEPRVYRGALDEATAQARNQTAHTTLQVEKQAAAARDDALGRIWEDLIVMGSVTAVVLLCGLWVIGRLSTSVSITLRIIADRMARVSVLDFDDDIDESLHSQSCAFDEVRTIRDSFLRMARSVRAFSFYVPETVVRMVHFGKVAKLGVRRRNVTIMFSKVVDFSVLASEVRFHELVPVFAEYLEAMTECIDESGGTVGKYMDESIMAFWNSPNDLEDHEDAACVAALEQQQRLEAIRKEWVTRGLPPIHARIGISAGTVLHGNIGCSKRMEWGIIGDKVNLASRLEAMGKRYGTGILLSGDLLSRLPKTRFLTRPIDRVVAYGKREVTEVHELVAVLAEASKEQLQACEDTEVMVTAYRARHFDEALARARTLAAGFPNDLLLAEVYEERCREFIVSPPPEEWDAVHVLGNK